MTDTLKEIREQMGHVSMRWKPALWLNTGIPDLNRVIGHKDRGIPYGRIIEISGLESMGKTAIVLSLSALGQRDNAFVLWGDAENSFDPGWAIQRGLERCPACKGSGREPESKACKTCGLGIPCSLCNGEGCKDCKKSGEEHGSGLNPGKLQLFQPYVGQFQELVKVGGFTRKKLSEPRLTTGPEMLDEMEKFAVRQSKKSDRMILVIDSLTALVTDTEAAAGLTGGSMHTEQALPKFLGRLLRRWVGLAQAHNILVILINQLRQSPNTYFGDGWYTPGGNAPRFYSHIRLRVSLIKGGRIRDGGKLIGLQGKVAAKKNKTGGEQEAEIGYRLLFNGPIEFLPVKDLNKDGATE